eukprot:TRINITY_DN2618_c0_g3_i1.p1 TRINITY_DN2618_c0_g3~~TRINITY_DN2618_c0_g3_i1.p1  ORF type:complete len:137 (+),score=31.61 TRINITY_DN2618_c0_g3_i1:63-473(+)
MTYTGKVVRWYDRKGFGFVQCDDFDADLYVHHTGFGGGNLIEGKTIHFDLEDDDRSGKKRCCNVTGDAIDSERRPQPRRRSLDRRDDFRRDSGDRYERRGRNRSFDRRDRDFDRRRDSRDRRGRDRSDSLDRRGRR